jgi:hypothetical protein
MSGAYCSFKTSSNLFVCPTDADNPGNMTINFDASNSMVGNYTTGSFTVANFYWEFGDGTTQVTSSSTTTNTYSEPGVYLARLVVRDDNYAPTPLGCPSRNSANFLVNIIEAPQISVSADATVECNTCASVDIIAHPLQ